MSIICEKCNCENRDDKFFCRNCGEKIQDEPGDKYNAPVKMLKEMLNNLSYQGFNQEKIEERLRDFMDLARNLIDKTHKDMEDNFSNVEDLAEKLAGIGEELPEKRSGEIVEKFSTRFQTAQDCINEGIFLAGESLKNIADLSDVEAGQGKRDLDRAMNLMEIGLNNLEFISETLEKELYLYKSVKPLPQKLTDAVSVLQKITLNMSEYTNNRKYELLPETVFLLDDMKECLREVMKTTKSDWVQETSDVEQEDPEEEEFDFLKDSLGSMLEP